MVHILFSLVKKERHVQQFFLHPDWQSKLWIVNLKQQVIHVQWHIIIWKWIIDGRHVPEAKVGSRGVFCTTVIKVSFSFYVESLIDMNNYSNGAQVHHAALSFRNESEGCLSILPAVWLDFHEAVAMALLAWAISTKYRFVWKMFFQLVWIVLNLLTFLQGQTNVPNLIG